MSIYCPKCGGRNDDSASVCRVCGKNLTPKGGPSAIFYIAAFVVIIVLLASFSPFLGRYGSGLRSGLASFANSLSPQQNGIGQNGISGTSSVGSTSTVKSTSTTTTTTTVPVTVQLTAVNLQIAYYDNATGLAQYYTKTFNGMTVTAGSQFPYTLQFSNNESTPYVINSIESTTPGFRVLNVSPSLPYTMQPDSTLSITSTIQAPNRSYTATLGLTVSETGLANKTNATISNSTRASNSSMGSNGIAGNSSG